jgi:hypothetical protein
VEEITNPEIIRPACIETISIEIEVSALPLTTIMESNQIPSNDLDNLNWNVELMSTETSSNSSTKSRSEKEENFKPIESTTTLAPRVVYFYGYDETVACLRVFKILKNLIMNW